MYVVKCLFKVDITADVPICLIFSHPIPWVKIMASDLEVVIVTHNTLQLAVNYIIENLRF